MRRREQLDAGADGDARRDVETLLGNLTVENGIRLVAVNLQFESGGLLQELELARSQAEALLEIIPTD